MEPPHTPTHIRSSIVELPDAAAAHCLFAALQVRHVGGERELAARLRLLVGLPSAAAADPSHLAARYPALASTTAAAPVDPYVGRNCPLLLGVDEGGVELRLEHARACVEALVGCAGWWAWAADGLTTVANMMEAAVGATTQHAMAVVLSAVETLLQVGGC
jgi:hypothetical protein